MEQILVLLAEDGDTGQWIEIGRQPSNKSGRDILVAQARGIRSPHMITTISVKPPASRKAHQTFFQQYNFSVYCGMKNSGWAVWTTYRGTLQKIYPCSDGAAAHQMYRDMIKTIKSTGVVTL